jgi:transcriptional regulator GlxA family with amidase domain
VKVLDVDGSPMRRVCSIAAGANVLLMARAGLLTGRTATPALLAQ